MKTVDSNKLYLKTQISLSLHQTSLAKDIKLLGGICGLETYEIGDFCVLDPHKMVFSHESTLTELCGPGP